MRLEINDKKKKKLQKNTNMGRLNNMLLNNQWITEEIKERSKNTWREIKAKHSDTKSMGCSKSSSKRKVYSDTRPIQETRKVSNKKPNLTTKGTRKRRKKQNPKVVEVKKS